MVDRALRQARRAQDGAFPREIDRAVCRIRRALRRARSLRRRLTLLLGLAALLAEVAERSNDPEAMRESVRVLDQAAAEVDLGHPFRAALLVHAACGADELHQMTGDVADAEAAVRSVERAYAAIGAQTADRAPLLATLCAVLVVAASTLPQRDVLDRAVELGAEAVAGAGTEDVGMVAGNLASALRVRYERRGIPADLAGALRAAEDSIGGSACDDHQAGRLAEFGHILGLAFDATASPELAARAVNVLRSAVAFTTPGSPAAATRIAALATALLNAGTAGEPAALAEAVALVRAALAEPPDDQPSRFVLYQHAATVLSGWAERLRERETAIEARRCAEAAVADASDAEDRAAARDTLATVLHTCYEIGCGPGVLDEAVAASRAALADTAEDSFEGIGYIGNLGVGYQLRYLAAGVSTDLDLAIEAHRRAAAALPPGHVDRAIYLNNLGVTLRLRHERTGDTGDLDAAVAAAREAVAISPLGRTDLPGRLGNLAAALHTRFQWYGDLADLDASIDNGRTAVGACPPGHLHLAGLLVNLGNALWQRHGYLGARADIDESIACLRAAVGEENAVVERPAALTGLGIALSTLYQLDGDQDTLRAAIAATEEAVGGTAARDPDLPGRLNNLVVQRLDLLEPAASTEKPDATVAMARRAVAALGPGHPDRAGMLSTLALALHGSHRATGNRAALDEAMRVASESLLGVPEQHPDRSLLLTNLALIANTRYTLTADPSDLHAVTEALRMAAASGASATVDRIDAAGWWGVLAARQGDPVQAAEAFEQAVTLLPELSPQRLWRPDAHRWLSEYRGIAADAAALAIEAGRPQRAVELLELGRGVLLGRSLRLDGIGQVLRRTDPELADRIERLRVALDAPGQYPAAPGALSGERGRSRASEPSDLSEVHRRVARTRLLEHRRELAEQLRQATAHARALPETSRLVEPATLPDLLEVADQGPVVLVNVSRYRCDALALTASGLVTVPLPDLGSDLVDTALATVPGRDNGPGRPGSDPPGPERYTVDKALAATLDALWTAIARPVLTELYRLGRLAPDATGVRRLWWVPTGPLALLPLHAATARDEVIGGTVRASAIVVSYAPTVGALRVARAATTATPPERYALVVGPDPAGTQALPAARAEAVEIAARLRTEVCAEAKSRDALLAELGSCTWLHLALHARFVAPDPSASHVLLPDGSTVTVAEIAAVRGRARELAYLSACETTSTSAGLADEAVHLAAAFQIAGFPQVIGTQWVVSDRVAIRVARGVYDRLLPDAAASGADDAPADAGHDDRVGTGPPSAAVALHAALASLRARYPDRPSAWAAQLHVGA